MSNSSDSDVSDSDIPTKEQCEERCQEFAAITGTDSALAMYYLQDRKWEVQSALNWFYDQSSSETPSAATASASATDTQAPAVSKPHTSTITTTSHSTSTKSKNLVPGVDIPSDDKWDRIRVLSWNIDGLDTGAITDRTEGVCKQIKTDNPDVVFLQEVVQKSQAILERKCANYQFLPSGKDGYYTAIMLRIDRGGSTTTGGGEQVVLQEESVTPFYSSAMARSLLKVKAKVKGVAMTLMTSHLESQAAHASERKRQLRICLDAMTAAEPGENVVFGGDLNLRDVELKQIGGLPAHVVDLWDVTGQRPEARYTWDLMKNDNLDWQFPRKPRCRFDRLYLRTPTNDTDSKHSTFNAPPVLRPVYFELAGIQRLSSCKRFPSDHWGILAHFDIERPSN